MDNESISLLARCHGFAVCGSDGRLGDVETPVFAPNTPIPDYLIVRADRGSRCGDRRWVVAVSLVERVSRTSRLVQVRGTLDELERLPRRLPITVAARSRR